METGSVSSLPSSSISNSSARSTPVPSAYKPITQSASLLALTKSPDEDLKRRSSDDLLQIVRRLETENRNCVAEHTHIVKDVNKRMHILLLEVRGLKDINQNLQDDNQELRDLCCFLDDDRQRGRKLAREWQRFGRYTASVMRSEVSAYQEKLKELEAKQQELISDNLDLKELCLYLDQERLRASQPRDEGDGSSSSTAAGNDESQQNEIELVPVNQLYNGGNNTESESATNEYIRQLEDKVRHLEKEKKKASKQLGKSVDGQTKDTPHIQVTGTQRIGPDGTHAHETSGGTGTNPNKPEAVVHAMKVLEVHENLERLQSAVGDENTLDDKEKAIVREMCNVVWRKLGNVKAEQQEAQHPEQHQQPPQQPPPAQPPLYENLQPTRSRSTPPESSGQPTVPSANAESYYTPTDLGQRSNTEVAGSSSGQPVAYIRTIDNSRGHTVFQVTPSHHTQDVGRSEDYPDPYHRVDNPTSQSQRPPPRPGSQPHGPPPNPHYTGQQGKYGYVQTSRPASVTPTGYVQTSRSTPVTHSGYVQTSRSTPVTPTPQLQSQPSNATQRMEPRSHSPGPVRRSVTPRTVDVQHSQSTGSKHHQQHPRSDLQSNPPMYQNHPLPSNMGGENSYQNQPLPSNMGEHSYQNHPLPSNIGGENSYENVLAGYNYNAHGGSQNFGSNHSRSHESVSSNYEYQAPPSQAFTQNPYPENSESSSNKISKPPNHYHPHPAQNQCPPTSSSQSPPFYQNMPVRNPTSKTNVRDPSPQGPRYPSQNAQPTALPQNQYSSHRNITSDQSHGQGHPSYPQPSQAHTAYPSGMSSGYSTQPPGYNVPPQYQDRRSSYIEARDSNQQPYDGRRNADHYYNK